MKCPNCNIEVPITNKICYSCGSSLEYEIIKYKEENAELQAKKDKKNPLLIIATFYGIIGAITFLIAPAIPFVIIFPLIALLLSIYGKNKGLIILNLFILILDGLLAYLGTTF